MPPSQLKKLKASLHQHGLTGPKQSKKRKKRATEEDWVQRTEQYLALRQLRDVCRPFEGKTNARPKKRDYTSLNKTTDAKNVVGRPGVSKALGEQVRRKVLLGEVHRRHKVGGLVDRRGKGDWTRLLREQRGRAKRRVFDLEDMGMDEVLTHMGRAIGFDGEEMEDDDFSEESLGESSEQERPKKRRKGAEDEVSVPSDEEELGKKKTRKEVMEEVIAKSKLHKLQRQQAKENDDAMREELDNGLGDLMPALAAFKPQSTNGSLPAKAATNGIYMNPERAAMINETMDGAAERDYDRTVRELTQVGRSQPSERTKTAEEKANEEAERQQLHREQRLKRMLGVKDDDDESDEDTFEDEANSIDPFTQSGVEDDAAEFGFKAPHIMERPAGFEDDEDEFIIDDDLVASEADWEGVSEAASDDEVPEEILALATPASGEEADEESYSSEESEGGDEDLRPASLESKTTYQIPLSVNGIEILMQNKPIERVPEIIRRIRAQYDPSISAANKPMLANFAQALVSYVRILAMQFRPAPLAVIEQVVRHVHSMSRTFPAEIAEAFRSQLDRIHKNKIRDAGDLALLTAISTIYPTSDHIHKVVTPATTVMAKWLGTTFPKKPIHLHIGAYLVTLMLKYQSFSKRYIPEAIRFTLLALRKTSSEALLKPHLANLRAMADMWHNESAFIEIFSPAVVKELRRLDVGRKELRHMTVLLAQARLHRRPLEMHNHRSMPIKSAVPKFEEGFNPERFYDPDAARSETNKLRKEFKRERKGAMRELRKDARFLAREQLKDKRERDRAYEEKYKKLVASVQAEEGHEAKEYDREKRARKRARK